MSKALSPTYDCFAIEGDGAASGPRGDGPLERSRAEDKVEVEDEQPGVTTKGP